MSDVWCCNTGTYHRCKRHMLLLERLNQLQCHLRTTWIRTSRNRILYSQMVCQYHDIAQFSDGSSVYSRQVLFLCFVVHNTTDSDQSVFSTYLFILPTLCCYCSCIFIFLKPSTHIVCNFLEVSFPVYLQSIDLLKIAIGKSLHRYRSRPTIYPDVLCFS